MPYGQVMQELTRLRADYEQFIIDRERERILNLLENPLHHNIRFPNEHTDCYTCVLLALIKGEK